MREILFICCLCSFLGISAQEIQQEQDDCFCRIIKNGAVEDLDVAFYNKEICLNLYDAKYVDCQFFLFMLEYAYRHKDDIAFLYLSDYLSGFYKQFNLTPNKLALDMIQEFRSQVSYDGKQDVSKDTIGDELKHKWNKSEEEMLNYDYYKVVCDLFSTDYIDHTKTSLLYETICHNVNVMKGPGDKEGQMFFLSLVLADQSKDLQAYISLINSMFSFYLRSGIKINDNVFEMIVSWIKNMPQKIERVEYLQKYVQYKEEVLKNKSACD